MGSLSPVASRIIVRSERPAPPPWARAAPGGVFGAERLQPDAGVSVEGEQKERWFKWGVGVRGTKKYPKVSKLDFDWFILFDNVDTAYSNTPFASTHFALFQNLDVGGFNSGRFLVIRGGFPLNKLDP